MTPSGDPSLRASQDGTLHLAERALSFATLEVQVTVIRERSLHARFARSNPTQATEVDDLTVHVLALCNG